MSPAFPRETIFNRRSRCADEFNRIVAIVICSSLPAANLQIVREISPLMQMLWGHSFLRCSVCLNALLLVTLQPTASESEQSHPLSVSLQQKQKMHQANQKYTRHCNYTACVVSNFGA